MVVTATAVGSVVFDLGPTAFSAVAAEFAAFPFAPLPLVVPAVVLAPFAMFGTATAPFVMLGTATAPFVKVTAIWAPFIALEVALPPPTLWPEGWFGDLLPFVAPGVVPAAVLVPL